MKNILVIVLVLLTIPIALAFSGSSDDYKLNYGIDAIGLSEGSSVDYEVISNLHYSPVGKFQSADYKVNLGPYYLISTIPCAHEADTDCDGDISNLELAAYAERWYIDSSDVTNLELAQAAEIWYNG